MGRREHHGPETIVHDDELRSLYLTEWLGERGYDAERVYYDQSYARRSCCASGCGKSRRTTIRMASSSGADYTELPLAERQRINENARRVCLREWLKQVMRDEMRLATYVPDEARGDGERGRAGCCRVALS